MFSDEVETAWVLLNNACACIELLIEDREAADSATPGEVRSLVDARAALARIEERLREEARDGSVLLLPAQAWERGRSGEFWLLASEGKAFLEGLRAFLRARKEFHAPIREATAALEDVLVRRLPARSG